MQSFLKSETGVVSVEYVLWLPIMLTVMMLGVDASVLLVKQGQLFDVNREISRQYALGVIEEADIDFMLELIWPESDAYSAAVNPLSADTVEITLEVPYSEVIIFGRYFAQGMRLRTRVVMAQEALS